MNHVTIVGKFTRDNCYVFRSMHEKNASTKTQFAIQSII